MHIIPQHIYVCRGMYVCIIFYAKIYVHSLAHTLPFFHMTFISTLYRCQIIFLILLWFFFQLYQNFVLSFSLFFRHTQKVISNSVWSAPLVILPTVVLKLFMHLSSSGPVNLWVTSQNMMLSPQSSLLLVVLW